MLLVHFVHEPSCTRAGDQCTTGMYAYLCLTCKVWHFIAETKQRLSNLGFRLFTADGRHSGWTGESVNDPLFVEIF